MYIEPEELASEGLDIEAADVRDRVEELILLAQAYIEHPSVCGQFFEKRTFTEESPLRMDGSGGMVQQLPVPAINVLWIKVDGHEIDMASVVVYNRTFPDDRRNPKVCIRDLADSTAMWPYYYGTYYDAQWPKGRLNIEMGGDFGYCDVAAAEGGGVEYVTPALIKKAVKLLVLRDLKPLADGGLEELRDSRIISETTDGHSYTLGGVGGLAETGGPTGDVDIDDLLVKFKRPPFCAVL